MTFDEKLKKVSELLNAGAVTVSPTVAAEVLDCKPYTLNVTARQGKWDTKVQGYFSGRNLRIYVSWLASILTDNEKARNVLQHESSTRGKYAPQ